MGPPNLPSGFTSGQPRTPSLRHEHVSSLRLSVNRLRVAYQQELSAFGEEAANQL